jgi:hypothetical protein
LRQIEVEKARLELDRQRKAAAFEEEQRARQTAFEDERRAKELAFDEERRAREREPHLQKPSSSRPQTRPVPDALTKMMMKVR